MTAPSKATKYGEALDRVYAVRGERTFTGDCRRAEQNPRTVFPYRRPRPNAIVKPEHLERLHATVGDLSPREKMDLMTTMAQEFDVEVPWRMGSTSIILTLNAALGELLE